MRAAFAELESAWEYLEFCEGDVEHRRSAGAKSRSVRMAEMKRDGADMDFRFARVEYERLRDRVYRCDHCGGVMDDPARRPVRVHRPTDYSDPGLLSNNDFMLPDLLIYCGSECFYENTEQRRRFAGGDGFLEGLAERLT